MNLPENKTKFLGLDHWKLVSFFLAMYDAVAVNAAFYIALWLRFDCKIWEIPPY